MISPRDLACTGAFCNKSPSCRGRAAWPTKYRAARRSLSIRTDDASLTPSESLVTNSGAHNYDRGNI